MKRCLYKRLAIMLAICAAGLLLQACTPKPYIPIRYEAPLPEISDQSLNVFFRFSDERPEPTVLRPNAKENFSSFSGYYALILASGGQAEVNLGAKSLPVLFQIAVGRLLESDGLRLGQVEKSTDANISFALKDFYLDYSEGSWTAGLAYEATLTGKKGSEAKRTVKASGERKKILGTREAEKLLGEIFTEAINKLELKTLALEAGLFP